MIFFTISHELNQIKVDNSQDDVIILTSLTNHYKNKNHLLLFSFHFKFFYLFLISIRFKLYKMLRVYESNYFVQLCLKRLY